MDYCEWKNGYRAEAMTGVTKSLISKLQAAVMGSVNNLVMGKIGYMQGRTIGTQTDKTKWWIFALGTGIPIISSSLGIIPKFFYPLSAEKRMQMYKELKERREGVAHIMNAADAGATEELARKEKEAMK